MRSYLYVPGDRGEMLAGAGTRGADAIIADLEDAVPPERKQVARETVAAFLRDSPANVWVRINGEEDAHAIAPLAPAGLSVPKVSCVADIERVDVGLPIIALIETADGVLDAREIARHPSVVRLALGEADLGAELGIDPSPDHREWQAVRTMIVLASAAAGLDAPVAPIATDFADLDALRESTRALRRMGFGARAAIHPAQIAIINESFTPSPDEVAAARRLIERFQAAGRGVTTDDDGRMIDEAVIRSARRILAQAGDPPA
ncbi:MAG TPA: CoA ester lyase [Actinomycetota bacterium]